jgi:sugar phosphate isomerase/epimerase
VDFEQIVRTLNSIGYDGPLSVEWEDSGMHREQGAPEALQLVRRVNISASTQAFDAAFTRK